MKRSTKAALLTIAALSLYTLGYAAEPTTAEQDRYSPEVTRVEKVDLIAEAVRQEVADDEPNSEDKQSATVTKDQKKVQTKQNEAPIKIQADSMYYEDTTGYMEASGKVDVYRLVESLHTEKIQGNTKTQQYTVPGELNWRTPTSNLVGEQMVYDGMNQSGSIHKVEGRFDEYYVRGENGEFQQGKGYIQKGMITTPSAMAKTPDYRIDGENIEIIPNDRMVIYNAKFYIKDKLLFTKDRYVSSLQPDDRKVSVFQLIPRPGYEGDYGFGIHGDFAYPITDRLDLAVNYYLYSELGFKPSIRARYYIPGAGRLAFGYMSVESSLNDYDVWVKKWPELHFSSDRFYLGDTGIYVSGEASIGDWEEAGNKGTHKGYSVRMSHQPIKITPKTNLRFFTGYMLDLYELKDSKRTNVYYGATLSQTIMPGWVVYGTYVNNEVEGRTPYRFDQIDINQKGAIGTIFKIDRLNSFGVYASRDLTHGKVDEVNYTWYRDLHSFAATLTYKTKEKEHGDRWEFQIWAKDFS